MFKLVFSSGELDEAQLSEKLNIGRDPSNDVVLPLPTVSGFHAELRVRNSKVRLADLNSTNGTYVNGQLITGEAEIIEGDNITFDTISARLEKASFEASLEVPAPLFLAGIESGNSEFFELNHLSSYSIGRDPASSICFEKQEISWHHAKIYVSNGQWILEDNDSTNGTFHNGQQIEKVLLGSGDIISFEKISFSVSSKEVNCKLITKSYGATEIAVPNSGGHDQFLVVSDENVQLFGSVVTVGRIEGNDVLLNNPTVSSRHAVLRYDNDNWWVEDLDSTNGTFVNKQKVTCSKIFGGDILKFGSEEVLFKDPSYVPQTTAPSVVIMIGED